MGYVQFYIIFTRDIITSVLLVTLQYFSHISHVYLPEKYPKITLLLLVMLKKTTFCLQYVMSVRHFIGT